MDYGKVTNARYGGLNTSAANEGLGGTPPPPPIHPPKPNPGYATVHNEVLQVNDMILSVSGITMAVQVTEPQPA